MRTQRKRKTGLTSIIEDKKNASSNWHRCRINEPIDVPTSNQSKLCVMKIVAFCLPINFAQLVVGINFDDRSNVYLALMLSTATISKFSSESSLAAG